MKKLFLNLTASLFALSTFAQNPSISSQVSIGGSSFDYLTKVIPTSDGYFLFGQSNSQLSGNKSENSRGGSDLWLVKTDLNHNIVWDKTIGGSGEDQVTDALLINDKIYVSLQSNSPASGEKTMDSYGEYDIWLLCLDLSGDIVWQNQFGGDWFEGFPSLTEYSDTSFLIAVGSGSPISGNKTVGTNGGDDIWLIEVSYQTGNDIHQRTIGSINHEGNRFISKLPSDTGYILRCDAIQGTSGDKTDSGYGASDIWLVELNQSLEVIRDKCFGGEYDERAAKAIYFDNTYIYLMAKSYSGVSGNKTSVNYGGEDAWVMKLDQDWNIIWDQSYGGSLNEAGSSMYRNPNGKLILSVNSESVDGTGNKTSPKYGNYDLWLLILNDDGSILTQETYGGYQLDAGFIVEQPGSSNQLLLQATSRSPVSGVKTVDTWGETDFWLAKLDASDFLNTVELSGSDFLISVYPNPFTDHINFDFGNLHEDVVLSIYGVDGKLLHEAAVTKGADHIVWTPKSSDAFMMYTIQGETVRHEGKIVRK